MPALNFQPQFAPMVLDGSKPCTIRQVRKRPIGAGDQLRLYTGQRTRHCRMLRDWTPCIGVQSIIISNNNITLGGKKLSDRAATHLIWRDGFRDDDDMTDWVRFYQWFCGPKFDRQFSGVLISWARHELLEIANE